MDKSQSIRVKRTQKDYTLGFKLAVVEQVEKGDMTYKQAQKHYGIQGRSTVLTWLRKHGTLDWSTPPKSLRMPHKKTPSQTIKRLERQLADEKKRTLLLGKIVEAPEGTTGVNKTKKSPTTSSGNSNKTSKWV